MNRAARVRMLGRIVDIEVADLQLATSVRARVVERAPGVTLVFWASER